MKHTIRVRKGDTVGLVTMDVRPCSVCRKLPHTRECDGPAPARASGTCDAKLCEDCRTVVPRPGAEDWDLCPGCMAVLKAVTSPAPSAAPRKGLYHVALPQPWPWAITQAEAPCMFPRADVAEGKRRWVPAPPSLHGAWLAVWASEYDDAAAEWMRSAMGLAVPGPEALPVGSYVGLAELSGCTSICNDGRAFREPWWGGTGRCSGTFAWWVEACAVEPLADAWAAGAKHLQLVPAGLVAELRRRYEATVGGRWWPPKYEPPRPRGPLHDDSPVPPMLEHPEQGLLL